MSKNTPEEIVKNEEAEVHTTADETAVKEDKKKKKGLRSRLAPSEKKPPENETEEEKAERLKKEEKKKKSFIFDQVMKAATALTNAVSNLDDSMSKEGIGKQIENIEGALVSLKDWIK